MSRTWGGPLPVNLHTIACDSVLETEAMVRNSMLIVRVMMKLMKKKKKNALGVLLSPAMKYKTMLKMMAFAILYGMSVNMDANASADG